MTRNSIRALLSIALAVPLASDAHAQPELPATKADPKVERLRSKLNFAADANAYLKNIPELAAMGEELLPAFAVILADPKSTTRQVDNALVVLNWGEMEKTNRKVLLEPVVARLADPNASVRLHAVGLLGEIGSERDTAPVVALLSDENPWVGVTAAETLVAIGGKRDLVAMDAWLKTGAAHRKHRTYPGFVKECRDKLEKRLKEATKDKKADVPRQYSPMAPMPRAAKP